MHTLFFLIGASGSGKTSVVRAFEAADRSGVRVFYFDSIGVPSEQERIAKWGGGESWQRAMTIEWVGRIKGELRYASALLDGQTRPSFIAEACEHHAVTCHDIILLDCPDDLRRARLLQRGQPELATAQMMEWARYLRRETTRVGGRIIDTENRSIAQVTAALENIIAGDERSN